MALFSKKQPTNDTFVVPLPETPAEVRRRRIISVVLIVILLAILAWAIIAIYGQSKDDRSENTTSGDSNISQPVTTDNSGVDSTSENNGSTDTNNSGSTGTTNSTDNTDQNQTSSPTDTPDSANSGTGTALPATGDMLAN